MILRAPILLAAWQDLFDTDAALRWLSEHGPVIVGIILGMFVLRYLVRIGSRRVARLVARNTHTDQAELEDRAETLASVFGNTAAVVILIAGVLMILEQFGIPVGPLLGGAAIAGLAIAFGAQNLIRDYFTGFMILLEDQYAVKDVVRINNIAGQVEKITLRLTILRDLSGTLHFVPHGTVTIVSNMTHGFSRAEFDVGIAYKEDTDRVLGVIKELCDELRRDEQFSRDILEDAGILGVDKFEASAVVLKFVIKTRPLRQWDVKREMLRRIKKRFDELGIEIPFPHVSVYHRNTDHPESGPRGIEN